MVSPHDWDKISAVMIPWYDYRRYHKMTGMIYHKTSGLMTPWGMPMVMVMISIVMVISTCVAFVCFRVRPTWKDLTPPSHSTGLKLEGTKYKAAVLEPNGAEHLAIWWRYQIELTFHHQYNTHTQAPFDTTCDSSFNLRPTLCGRHVPLEENLRHRQRFQVRPIPICSTFFNHLIKLFDRTISNTLGQLVNHWSTIGLTFSDTSWTSFSRWGSAGFVFGPSLFSFAIPPGISQLLTAKLLCLGFENQRIVPKCKTRK